MNFDRGNGFGLVVLAVDGVWDGERESLAEIESRKARLIIN